MCIDLEEALQEQSYFEQSPLLQLLALTHVASAALSPSNSEKENFVSARYRGAGVNPFDQAAAQEHVNVACRMEKSAHQCAK